MKKTLKKIIPHWALSAYYFCVAIFAAFAFGFPSRNLIVIGVTGTKGKSSTTEFVNAILEEAGLRTAVMNSIRFKLGDESKPNLLRMSMPGRFFIQRFLFRALLRGCNAVVLEMTSEGARQFRHRGIALDALIFTNLAPEHIESHGSFEKYADAKFELGKQLARSRKKDRVMVANADDPQSARYLALPVEKTVGFSLKGHAHRSSDRGGSFEFDGSTIAIHLPGDFSLQNALAAAELAHALGVATPIIKRGLEKVETIPGRAEEIDAGQDFTVVVDYAHTPDSLSALYDAYGARRKICVLGNTGGGRDTWKRPVMGRIASERCDDVILTNEDPYDEDPRAIVDQMARGMKRKPTIIMDRREAIREALRRATTLRQAQGSRNENIVVLISGKGTDPCICVENGKKIPWSDASVAREELLRMKRV